MTGAPSKKLLIADDDPILLELVSVTLRSHAYEIVPASNGVDALSLAQEHRPSLAILDQQMPGLQGIEVCRRIVADANLTETTVVILTASHQHEEEALSAGARAYLTKPFSPLQLLHLVEEVMATGPAPGRAQGSTFPERAVERPSQALAAFLFADVRGFTDFTARRGDAAAFRLAREFYRLTGRAAALHGGREVKREGDSVLFVFPTAREAVGAAVAAVKAIDEYNRTNPGWEIPAGFGIDAGEPVESGGDYIGTALNRASRLTARARAGEILTTETVRQLAPTGDTHSFADLGSQPVPGFEQTQRVYRVLWPGAPDFPAQGPAGHQRGRLPLRAALLVGGVLTVAALGFGGLNAGWDVWSPAATAPSREALSISDRVPSTGIARAASQALPFTVRIVARPKDGVNLGTGVIYDASGLVVTNAHVVAAVESVEVHLHSGAAVTAQVLGRSLEPDLAVLKLPGGPYPAAVFAVDTPVEAGEEIVALGYPMAFALGSEPTVTRGIVSKAASGLGGQYLQTDAPINPGDSGGPLLNLQGEVIGINVSRIESLAGRAVQNIGFAIPAPVVRATLPRLEAGRGEPVPLPDPRLQRPDEVVRSFHYLTGAGEFGLAYGLASARLKSEMAVSDLVASYGFAGKLAVRVVEATVRSGSEHEATVHAVVSVSVLDEGQLKSIYYDQTWRLVSEGGEWKIDAQLSSRRR